MSQGNIVALAVRTDAATEPTGNATLKPSVGVIVDDHLQILEFVGDTAPLIRLPAGAATLSLAHLLTESLRPIVLEVLDQARQTHTQVKREDVPFYEAGLPRKAVLSVTPEGPNRWRIQLDRPRQSAERPPAAPKGDSYENVTRELEAANEKLRATVNELVAANHEIRSSQTALEQSYTPLRERYDFITAVLDTLGALVLVVDPDGRIVEFNRACEIAAGLSREEARGLSCWDLIPFEQLREVQEVFAQLLTAASANIAENDWVSRNGVRHCIAWSNTTMRHPDGRVAYVIATGMEVTDRHLAEQALQASEAKFRAVIENAAEAIVCINSEGRIIIANPAASRIFGYSQQELLQRNLSQLLPERNRDDHEGHQLSYFELPLPRRIGSGSSITGRRKDGSEVPLEATLSAINTPSGQLAVAFIQDITERVVHRRHLQSLAGKLLKVQEEERRRIARNLHDDLTQTISLLGMKLGFLKQDVTGSPDKLIAGLDDARHQVDLIHEEVRAISHRLHPSALEYSGLVPALESLVGETEKLDRPRIHLVVGDLPDPLPTATASALYRIAQEALHNAVKSADADNVSIHLAAENGNVRMVIIDDGRGFKLDRSRRSGGLGLVSMEERARALDGHFAIHSAPGSGTRIEVDVPLSGAST